MTAEQFEKERMGNHNYHDSDDEILEGVNAFDADEREAGGGGKGPDNKSNAARRTGKKARRNYEERKRRKELYQNMIDEQINQGGDFLD